MRAVQVGLFHPEGKNKEICVICGGYHEAMYRDCHMQAICSKECHEVYVDMFEQDRNALH